MPKQNYKTSRRHKQMFNLNDPKLTKQQKEFMLSLQTDKELKEEVDRHKLEGFNRCFPSYWVVKVEDLIEFNKAAHQIDTAFDFDKEGLEEHHPEFDCLMFEGERVEIGEWDETYKRWSSHSYQRVGVIFIHGSFEGLDKKGISYGRFIPELDELNTEDPDGEDYISPDTEEYKELKKHIEDIEFKYPASFGKNKTPKNCLGMIDIPLHLLNDYEDKRVYDRQFFISRGYEGVKECYLKDREDYYEGVDKAKKNIKKFKNSKRKKKDFKSFGGGFGK